MSSTAELVLYSERGLVFALAQWLERDVAHVARFLGAIVWGIGAAPTPGELPGLVRRIVQAPDTVPSMKAWVLVEPSFGNYGFGNPDMIVVVEVEPGERHTVFVEAKVGSYFASARPWDDLSRDVVTGFNSTINGQLSLKYRLVAAFPHSGAALREPQAVFDWFRGARGDPGAAGRPRHLKHEVVLREIVSKHFKGVTPERCSFVAITDETNEEGRNPFLPLGHLPTRGYRPPDDRLGKLMPPPFGASPAIAVPHAPFAQDSYRHVTEWIDWNALADGGRFPELASSLRSVIGGIGAARGAPVTPEERTTFGALGLRPEAGAWPDDRAELVQLALGEWQGPGSWLRDGKVRVKAVCVQGGATFGISSRFPDGADKIRTLPRAFVSNPPRGAGEAPFVWIQLPWTGWDGGVEPWKAALAVIRSAIDS